MCEKAVEIKALEVSFGNVKALKGIDFEIKKGELVSVVGPSGCGKTTLIKSIAGLVPTTSEKLYLNGNDCNGKPTEKRGAVIVFQDLRLFPHMNVYENMAFPMEVRGISREEQRKKVGEMLSAIRLEGFEKRRISQLSGGQMQRVALGRALCADPDILLLDEPFSGLDENLKIEMENLVIQLHEELNLTTVMVTHDRAEALRISDRIAVMREGNILQFDSPENIYERPADRWIAQYFGAVNIYDESSEIYKLFSPKDKGRECIFFRPHDVRIRPKIDFEKACEDMDNHHVPDGVVDETLLCLIERISYEGSICIVKMDFKGEKISCSISSDELSRMDLRKGQFVGVKINEVHSV